MRFVKVALMTVVVDSVSTTRTGPPQLVTACLSLMNTRPTRFHPWENAQKKIWPPTHWGTSGLMGSVPRNSTGYPLWGMTTYLIFFAPGLASVPWIVNTELYPMWARGTGNGLATATNWIFNFIVSMTFLSLVSLLGKHGVFMLYTSLSVVGMIFTAALLPETKGKKLEDLEQLFKRSTIKS
ncbi:proton myo-inositol cotransporter-like [Liolophura sinensis]|uniref:proton myo-inositol cotransporter-like n=1 Tax=Liolophura sinensis TaxID=3198878 RepID=UPI00315941B5